MFGFATDVEVPPISKNVVPRALVTLLTSAVLKLKEKGRRGARSLVGTCSALCSTFSSLPEKTSRDRTRLVPTQWDDVRVYSHAHWM